MRSMLEVAFAQLRFAASLLFGVRFHQPSLERLVAALKETRREFGEVSSAAELVGPPELDSHTLRAVQERRFRTQARRAISETDHYAPLAGQLAIDPDRLRF